VFNQPLGYRIGQWLRRPFVKKTVSAAIQRPKRVAMDAFIAKTNARIKALEEEINSQKPVA
jgi:hypothetical protein